MTPDELYDYLGDEIEVPPNHTVRWAMAILVLLTALLVVAEPLRTAYNNHVMEQALRIAARVKTPDPDWVWRAVQPYEELHGGLSLYSGSASTDESACVCSSSGIWTFDHNLVMRDENYPEGK